MEAIHVLAVSVTAAVMSLIALNVSAKSEHASRDEATATVGKGAQCPETSGKDNGYAEITHRQGQFVDRDPYLVVYGLDGVVRARSASLPEDPT